MKKQTSSAFFNGVMETGREVYPDPKVGKPCSGYMQRKSRNYLLFLMELCEQGEKFIPTLKSGSPVPGTCKEKAEIICFF